MNLRFNLYEFIRDYFRRLGLALFCILILDTPLLSQNTDVQFTHLSTRDGLSQSTVTCILKESLGFMWFGTTEGLNKYDGYRFSIYKHDPLDKNSIGSNYINDVVEGAEGNLWVATSIGLDKFDRKKDTFTHYYPAGKNTIVRDIFIDSHGKMWLATTEGLYSFSEDQNSFTQYLHNVNDNSSLSNDFIYKITEDKEHHLWIGTKQGLNRFNPSTEKFVRYQHDPNFSRSIGGDVIKTVYCDKSGNIWIGTQGAGIALYNRKENSFVNFKHDPAQINTVAHNDILSFAQDDGGRLWIGTENGGISILDNKTFTHYKNDLANPESLSSNSIYSLYKDDLGNIWAGTWSGGVNLVYKLGAKFTHYKQLPFNKNSLNNSIVLNIGEDSYGYIWIGTDGGGLNRFDRKTKTFTHYTHDLNDVNTPKGDYVLSFVEADKGVLAIGYHQGGFDLFNTITGKFTHHIHEKGNPNSLCQSSTNIVFKDMDGNIWLGSWGDGLGLYHQESKEFTWYQHSPENENSIVNNFIHSICEDEAGNLWIGTETGLDRFDRKNKTFQHFVHNPTQTKSLSSSTVDFSFKDHADRLWFGTLGGLNLFDKNTQTFKAYTERDSLANNNIRGILEDNRGNLWITSNRGLSKFNPATGAVRNFEVADGLQGEEFKAHSCYQTKDGEMFFGGPNGFNSFYPDSIKDNTYIPPIFVTDLQVFNKSIKAGGEDSILCFNISSTRKINLKYNQSVFTFEFAALNYTVPEGNQYAYMLEGFDKEWNYVGTKRTATYTNLSPGKYIFHVKGSNNDGIWNKKGTSLEVIITPPYWGTWWFRVSIALLAIASVYAFITFRIRDINKIKRKLEKQVGEQTAAVIAQKEVLEAQAEDMRTLNEQLKNQTDFLSTVNLEIVAKAEEAEKARQEADSANRAKSIFLATMSHEIRTPMNGVLGMTALLAETTLNEEQQDYTDTIRTSGEALLTVINDILDFSKIESGHLELDHHTFNLRQCIEEVMDLFAAKSAEKKLDLVYQIDHQIPAQIVGDSHRLKQILINLVGNAMKFTEQGEIFVGIDVLKTSISELELAFQVRDTGIGISQDKISRLFKAFSQVDSSTTRKYGGTGLGLVISERLVQLMGGDISVESQAGVGTTFSFIIKATISHEPIREYAHFNAEGNEGKKVLVVDDNLTNLTILKGQLEQWKLVPLAASSAKQALEFLSMQNDIAMVISDMQMPEMDGLQLSQQIKKTHNNLPIILLSSIGDETKKKYPELFFSILNKPAKQLQLYKAVQQGLRPLDSRNLHSNEQKLKKTLNADFAVKHPLKIMLAEDNIVNQKLAIRILNKLGYTEIEVAQNGLEAVEKFGDNFYDVILMDVQMPEMDGLEATRLIRSKHYHQPVIISMTANASNDDREICLQAGMNDFVSKPIKLEELIHALEKAHKFSTSESN